MVFQFIVLDHVVAQPVFDRFTYYLIDFAGIDPSVHIEKPGQAVLRFQLRQHPGHRFVVYLQRGQCERGTIADRQAALRQDVG